MINSNLELVYSTRLSTAGAARLNTTHGSIKGGEGQMVRVVTVYGGA